MSGLRLKLQSRLNRCLLVLIYIRWAIGIYVYKLYVGIPQNAFGYFTDISKSDYKYYFWLFPLWVLHQIARSKNLKPWEIGNKYIERITEFIEKNLCEEFSGPIAAILYLLNMGIFLCLWFFGLDAFLSFLYRDVEIISNNFGINEGIAFLCLIIPIAFGYGLLLKLFNQYAIKKKIENSFYYVNRDKSKEI